MKYLSILIELLLVSYVCDCVYGLLDGKMGDFFTFFVGHDA